MNTLPAVTVELTSAHEGRMVIGLGGEIDHTTASYMYQAVLALTLTDDAHGALADGVELLLDFTRVRFCDSSGMAALIGVWRHLHARGGSLRVAAVPANIGHALRIGGLDEIITIVPPDPAPPAGASSP